MESQFKFTHDVMLAAGFDQGVLYLEIEQQSYELNNSVLPGDFDRV